MTYNVVLFDRRSTVLYGASSWLFVYSQIGMQINKG